MKRYLIIMYALGMPFWLAGLLYGYAACVFRGGMVSAENLLRKLDEDDK